MRTPAIRLSLIAALALLATAVLYPAAAQQNEPLITVQGVDSESFPRVTAHATVTDGRGIPIEGLTGRAFTITEDGQPVSQVVVGPSERPDRPISLVLCLDVSHSLGEEGVEAVRNAALALLDNLPPDAHDRIALITFGNPNEQSITILRDFTDDIAKLRDIVTEDIAIGPERAYTAFWGAAYKALERLDADPEAALRRRRAVIILTDGRDNSAAGTQFLPEDTQRTQEQVAEYAGQLGVPLYPISFGDQTDIDALEALAVATQGVSYVSATPRAIEDAFADVIGKLRSEYRIDFTSSLPADGAEHELSIRVSHQAYTSAPATFAFTAVPHPVEVSLNLEEDQTVIGNVLIQPEIQAYAPIAGGYLNVNGSLLQEFGSGDIRYTWNTTRLAPGAYSLELFVRDTAGNTGRDTVAVNAARPITVGITAPARNARLAGAVEITVMVETNAADLNEVILLVDGNEVDALVAPAPGELTFTWETSTVELGGHQIEVLARDTVGNEVPASVVINVVEPLTVEITAPADNADVSGPVQVSYTAEANVAPLEAVTLWVDGEPYAEGLEDGDGAIWDSNAAALGEHTLTLRAADAAGNPATDEVTVSVERTLSVEITAPEAGARVAGRVPVEFTFAGAPSDVTRVQFFVGDLELEEATAGLALGRGANTLTWHVGELEPGLRQLAVHVTDTLGRDHADTTFVNVVEPLTVSITEPAEGAVAAEVMAVAYTVEANAAPLQSVVLWVDGELYAGASGDEVKAEDAYDWYAFQYTLGAHTLEIVAADTAGNEQRASVEVTVVRPVEVEITAPEARTNVAGEVTVEFILNALPIDVADAAFWVEGRRVTTLTDLRAGPNALMWDAAEAELGLNQIEIRVTDTAGEAHGDAVVVNVVEPLTVRITSPAPGATVTDDVVVGYEFIANTGDLVGVSLWVDGADIIVADPPPDNALTWETGNFHLGAHTLGIAVLDASGNTDADAIDVTVDRTTRVSIQQPEPGAAVAGPIEVRYNLDGLPFDVRSADLLVDDRRVTALSGLGVGMNAIMWDSGTVDLGAHTLEVRLVDTLGREVSAPVTVNVVAPLVVEVTSPGQGAVVGGQVDVAYAVDARAAPLYDVALRVDGVEVAAAGVDEDGNIPAEAVLPWDTTAFALGEHTLEVIATDTAGRQESRTVTVEVLRPLIVAVQQPTLNAEVAGEVEVRFGLGGSPADVARAAFLVDDRRVATIRNLQAGDNALSWDAGAFDLGPHQLEIRLTDTLGNEINSTVSVNVVAPLPLEIVDRRDEDDRHIVTYRAEARAASLERVSLLVDGAVIQVLEDTPPLEGELTWETVDFALGEHTLEVRAVDADGREATAATTVTVSRPLGGTVTLPSDNAEVAGVVTVRFTLTGRATDASRVVLFVGEQRVAEATELQPGPNALTWDAGLAGVGAHLLELQVYDTTGALAATDSVLVEVIAPLEVALAAPVPNAEVAGEVQVRYDVEVNAVADLERLTLLVDGEATVVDDAPKAAGALTWDASSAGLGAHQLELIAEDSTGNTQSATVSVSVVQPVVLEVLAPARDEVVAGVVTVRYRVETNAAELDRVILLVDGKEVAEAAEGDRLEWDTTTLAPGVHEIEVRAVDAAGYTDAQSLSVTVQNPLVVRVLSPEDGADVAGRVDVGFSVEANAAALASVVLLLDGEEAVALEPPQTAGAITWDAGETTLGEHRLTVRAEDTAGNVDEAGLTVTVTRPLVVEVVAPVEDTQVSGTVTVRYRVNAALDEVESAMFLVDGREAETVRGPLAETAFTWETGDVGAGAFELAVTVRDVTGAEQTSEPVKVRVIYQGNNLPLFILVLVVLFIVAIAVPIVLRRRRETILAAASVGEAAGGAATIVAAGVAEEVESEAKAYLVAEGGPTSGTRWSLARSETIIGRSRTRADVVVTGRAASRQHARISRRGEDFIYMDLKPEENPSQINGRSLRGQHTLQEGDVIEVGDTRLRFTREA